MKKSGRLSALALALAILAGCGGTENFVPDGTPSPEAPAPAESAAATPSPEETAWREAAEAAEAALALWRWPEEREVKTLAGQEVEFLRHHGDGWSILIPLGWERNSINGWRAPSDRAGLTVSKCGLPVNDPKIYRAQQGSWRHDTGYPAPFDYYYDDDGGYTPPKGSADCVYFFAPAGENSYELTLSGTAGETTGEEKAILEAMLLSFTQDESSRTLYGEDYQPGASEWDFAMTALLAQGEKLWGSWVEDGQGSDVDCKTTLEYVPYAQALGEFAPGEFVQLGGGRPEGMEGEWPDTLTLCLPDSKLWLYFYKDSPWAGIDLAGEEWWTRVSCPSAPEKTPYDAALAWLEAERAWQAEQ